MREVCLTSLLLLVATTTFAQDHHPGVNAVLGDVSWSGASPQSAPEKARLSAHLRYVHSLLSVAPTPQLSSSAGLQREELLAQLVAYANDGRFPQRDADGHSGRRPRFIDPRGVHCAVGHLMAQSGAGGLARRIARTENDAFVDEIMTPGVSAWASRNGFTLHELAMIQPSYESAPTEESTRREIEHTLERVTLSCASEHTPVESFRIRVRGDDEGAVSVRARGRSPFVACVVEHLQSRGGGAYDSQPRSFRFRMRVEVTPPQSRLRDALRAIVLGGNSQCVPSAGDALEYAAVNVSVTQRRRRVRVRTHPRNVPAANCLAAFVHARLRDYPPGEWNLRASAVLPVAPLVSDEWLGRMVDSHGRNGAARCMRELGLSESAPITIQVSGHRDAGDYEVEVRADSQELSTCVEGQLSASLREATSRGSEEDPPFFRIDADGTTSRELQPQTYEEIQREMERYDDQMH